MSIHPGATLFKPMRFAVLVHADLRRGVLWYL